MSDTELGSSDSYGVNEAGFLCHFDPAAVQLPDALEVVRSVAKSLPQAVATGQVRMYLADELQRIDVGTMPSCSEMQARVAMVHYAFLTQAYVWGALEPPRAIPRYLARPLVALAQALNQQPILTYRSYVLDNWVKLRPADAVELGNIATYQAVVGGQDEEWFIAVHVAVEACVSSLVSIIRDVVRAVDTEDTASIKLLLVRIREVLDDALRVFRRMPERCDPYIYYRRVRPFIQGWKDNPTLPEGLIYEGVDRLGGVPQRFRGETGAQSSIVPVLDALLGIDHDDTDELRPYLDDLHDYRPDGHRRLIDDVRRRCRLREFVVRVGSPELKAGYNACIDGLGEFRKLHLDYARAYVFEQASRVQRSYSMVGTGGTPFMRYLDKHHRETVERMLR